MPRLRFSSTPDVVQHMPAPVPALMHMADTFDSCWAHSNTLLCSIRGHVRQKLFLAPHLQRPRRIPCSLIYLCQHRHGSASSSAVRTVTLQSAPWRAKGLPPIGDGVDHRLHRRAAGAEGLQYQTLTSPTAERARSFSSTLTHQCRKDGYAPADMLPAASTLALAKGQWRGLLTV